MSTDLTPESAEAELATIEQRAVFLRSYLAAYAEARKQAARRAAYRVHDYEQCSWCGTTDQPTVPIVRNVGTPDVVVLEHTGQWVCRTARRTIVVSPEQWRATLPERERAVVLARFHAQRAS